MAAVFYSDSFAPTGGEVEMGFLLKKPAEGKIPLTGDMVMQVRELPAVATMATVIQLLPKHLHCRSSRGDA